MHIAAKVNSCNALRLLRRWQDSKGTGDDEARQSVHVNSQTPSGETALHYSARAGCEQCLRDLLEAGANAEAGDNKGETALHVAVLEGNVMAVRQLCEHLVNYSPYGLLALNQRDNGYRTPLHCGIINDRYDVVLQLLSCGADVQATDTSAATPLLTAIRKQNLPLMK